MQHVTDDGTVTAREASSGRKVPRTVRLPADYVAEHTHLSYAATAYGVQGATTDRSHTILTDSTSAASVYVGMTRGRNENLLHIVADSQTEPRAQFVAAMQRDRADRGLADAPQRTVEEVAGLAADGPVKLVNDEIATLMTQKQDAEQRAERLTRMAQRLDAQTWQHRAEAADSTLALEAARERLERSRGMVRPLILALVQVDAQSHEEATARQIRAAERVRKASQFGKPKARKVHRIAAHNANMVRARLNELWGSTPTWSEPAEIWAARVADCAVEDSAEVKDATLALRSAELQQKEMSSRHEAECRALLRKLYGAEQVRRDPTRYEFARPRREAQEWARIAEEASAEIAALRALPPEQAATQIEVKRAVAEAAREAQEQERAARKEQMRGSFKVRRNGAERGGPMLGI